MFGLGKKVNTVSTDTHPSHNVSNEQVERAAQILAIYLANHDGSANELEVELRNFGCKDHGKIGDFRISVEKI